MLDHRRRGMVQGLSVDTDGIPDPSTVTPQSLSYSGQPRERQRQHPSTASHFEHNPFHNPLASQRSNLLPQQAASKVAIPRLSRGLEAVPPAVSSVVEEKSRVSHACEPCRHRKTKCSGERPSCKHCEDFRIHCVYADRRREKSKKEIGVMAKRIDEYERVLRGLASRVDGNDQRLIHQALEHECTLGDDETLPRLSSRKATASTVPVSADGDVNDKTDGEASVGLDDEVSYEGDDAAHVLTRGDSTRSLGHADEDFNRTAASRATGFMGRNSELTWMQRLKKQAEMSPGGDEDAMPMSGKMDANFEFTSLPANLHHPINESTYHCDDLSMLVPGQVEPYEVPSRQTADMLFEHYLDSVHPAFPIIGRTTFLDQYRTFYSKNVQAGANWLAILNLIFAIGAKYSRLIQADWGGDERDHLIYFTRARLLGFNTDSILDHAGLQSVQIAGLMAFYLTATNQINRAWTFSGIAMRHACTLGLNLQNSSTSVGDSSREIRHRVWWAICSVDFRLAVMTGRPSAFSKAESTVALPSAVDEEWFFGQEDSELPSPKLHLHARYSNHERPYKDDSPAGQSPGSSTKIKTSPTEPSAPAFPHTPTPPSHASYFLLQTKLGLVTNGVLEQLYRSNMVTRSCAHVQLAISKLTVKLEQWQTSLPSVFDFSKKQRDQQFSRQRICLGFFYYSTLMIISRPCLCRVNRTIPNASGISNEFNRATAARCVHAAKEMLDLLPDQPNPVGLYKVAPWWCLVHHLVQAATVSMLELSYGAVHLPEEVEEILRSAMKAVQWLRSMAQEDLAAHRAWRLCEDMLHKVASIVGRPVDNSSKGGLPQGGDSSGGSGGSDGSGGSGGSGSGSGSSFDYPYHMPSAGADEMTDLEETFTPLHPTEGVHRSGPFRERSPLQAHIYTSYDEFSLPFLHSPPMTAPETPSEFLAMSSSPNQMEGLLCGHPNDLPGMTHYDQARC